MINSPEIKISVNRLTGKIGMIVDFIINAHQTFCYISSRHGQIEYFLFYCQSINIFFIKECSKNKFPIYLERIIVWHVET